MKLGTSFALIFFIRHCACEVFIPMTHCSNIFIDPVDLELSNQSMSATVSASAITGDVKGSVELTSKTSQISLKPLSSQSMQALNASNEAQSAALNKVKPLVESINNAIRTTSASSRRSSAVKLGHALSISSLSSAVSVAAVPSTVIAPMFDVAYFLKSHPLFSSCGAHNDSAFISSLSNHMHIRHLQPGDFICREGETGRAMFFLLRGTVTVSSKDGESTYAELTTGSLFGEIGVVMDMPRTANVVAKTKCFIAALGRDDFAGIVEKYPRIGEGIREQARKRYQQILQHSSSKTSVSAKSDGSSR